MVNTTELSMYTAAMRPFCQIILTTCHIYCCRLIGKSFSFVTGFLIWQIGSIRIFKYSIMHSPALTCDSLHDSDLILTYSHAQVRR